MLPCSYKSLYICQTCAILFPNRVVGDEISNLHLLDDKNMLPTFSAQLLRLMIDSNEVSRITELWGQIF